MGINFNSSTKELTVYGSMEGASLDKSYNVNIIINGFNLGGEEYSILDHTGVIKPQKFPLDVFVDNYDRMSMGIGTQAKENGGGLNIPSNGRLDIDMDTYFHGGIHFDNDEEPTSMSIGISANYSVTVANSTTYYKVAFNTLASPQYGLFKNSSIVDNGIKIPESGYYEVSYRLNVTFPLYSYLYCNGESIHSYHTSTANTIGVSP